MSLIPNDDLTQRLLAKILAAMFKDEMMKELRLTPSFTDQCQPRKKTHSPKNTKRQQIVHQGKSSGEKSFEPFTAD